MTEPWTDAFSLNDLHCGVTLLHVKLRLTFPDVFYAKVVALIGVWVWLCRLWHRFSTVKGMTMGGTRLGLGGVGVTCFSLKQWIREQWIGLRGGGAFSALTGFVVFCTMGLCIGVWWVQTDITINNDSREGCPRKRHQHRICTPESINTVRSLAMGRWRQWNCPPL